VGKLEDFEEDMEAILQRANVSISYGKWRRFKLNVQRAKANNASFYLKQVRKSLLRQLHNVLRADFEVFDYSPRPYI